MNRLPLLTWATTALAVLLAAAPTGATVHPPVDIILEADADHIPVPGEVLPVSFVFLSDASIDLVTADVTSGRNAQGQRHWEVVMLDAPVETPLTPGVPVRMDAELLCHNPEEPLFVEFRVGTFRERRTFRLSPAVDGQSVMMPGTGLGSPVALDPAFLRPEPAEAAAKAAKPDGPTGADEEDGPRAPATAVRTAYGSVRYGRPPQWADDSSGADGVTVRLYDQDVGPDDLLGTAVTDAQGNFSIDFLWIWSGEPDLYVQYETANSRVSVLVPVSGFDAPYRWTSATRTDEGSAQVNFGSQTPMQWDHMAPLHACTQLTRAWRKVVQMGYAGIDPVKCRLPESDWPHYKGGSLETIYMSEDRKWEDGTLWHEYGHHIVHELGAGSGTDYCNAGDRCDYINGDDSCRHCNWCQETAADAWNEGFPSWFSDVMGRVIHDEYAAFSGEALAPYDYETVGTCGTGANGTGGYDDPNLTEGALAAMLRDFEDTEADADDRGDGVGMDMMNVTATDVFDIMALHDPTTPQQFLAHFAAAHAGSIQQVWFTARNNGFNFDVTPPGAVTNLGSPSHTAVPSPDATIAFTWTPPADDISGVGDYSVWIGPAPQAPDFSADGVGDAASLTTEPLPPGTYWFSIRARDHAGNWSQDWATFGPVAIRDPYPANLHPASTAAFAAPVVPTQDPLALPFIAPAPTFLPPAPANTYLSLCVGNDGELPTDAASTLHARVDGVLTASSTVVSGAPAPGQYAYAANQGPFPVRGGRHTVGLEADALEVLAEPSETDNTHQGQWVWSPYLAPPGLSRLDAAPPRPYAGWYHDAPLFQAPNCVGLRMLAGGEEAAAVYLIPQALDDDYGLLSHTPSTGPDNGFSYILSQALSYRGPGRINAVLVGVDAAGGGAWDVGVLNNNGGRTVSEGDWLARSVASTALAVDAPQHVSWSDTEALSLFHNAYPRIAADRRVVRVTADPSVGPLNVAVYPLDMDHAGLLDHAHYARTSRTGALSLAFEQSNGLWTIAVWRDPADQPDGAMPLEPAAFTIELTPERPNLIPAEVAGWHAPLVPRPAADGTPASVPAPTTLTGDAAQTWLNAAVRNERLHQADITLVRQVLDGAAVSSQTYPVFGGLTTATWNAPSPLTVRGGRHTLSLQLDPTDTVAEEVEDDNTYGAQWSWIPSTLPLGSQITRLSPPDPLGGWADVTADGPVPLAFNTDGLRTPAPAPSGDDGHWLALAATPSPAADVDLRLFEADDSPATGFSTPVTSSIFGPGQTDYVLANFRAGPPRPLDVGVVRAAGTDAYQAEITTSTFLADTPAGAYGPFPLAAGRVLALHEVRLPAGPVRIELLEEAGGLDWGLTLHRANLALQSKSTPMPGGQAWTQPAGASEAVVVDVPETGFYCLAVWKALASDAPAAGSYRLVFDTSVGVDGGPEMTPSRTAIAAVRPNPFNPRTEVSFDLARAGKVTLRVYDVQGRLVRTLVDGELPAGRHQAAWSGTDDAGQAVASGVFLARLTAGGVESRAKLLLIK